MAQTVERHTTPTASPAGTVPAAPDPGSALPAASTPAGEPWTNGGPRDPDAIRRDIERTRSRMSETLDALEAELVREKEALVRTVTLQPVREKLKRQPWKAMAIAFAAGYIIAAIRD